MSDLQEAVDHAAAPKWSEVVIVLAIAIYAVLYYQYKKLKDWLAE